VYTSQNLQQTRTKTDNQHEPKTGSENKLKTSTNTNQKQQRTQTKNGKQTQPQNGTELGQKVSVYTSQNLQQKTQTKRTT